jgi:hypothetical protein
METAMEWVHVIVAGGFWGAFMFLFFAWQRSRDGRRPVVRVKDMLVWIFGGLLFGIWDTFALRAFKWPLILVMIGSVLCIYVTGKFIPPGSGKQKLDGSAVPH